MVCSGSVVNREETPARNFYYRQTRRMCYRYTPQELYLCGFPLSVFMYTCSLLFYLMSSRLSLCIQVFSFLINPQTFFFSTNCDTIVRNANDCPTMSTECNDFSIYSVINHKTSKLGRQFRLYKLIANISVSTFMSFDKQQKTCSREMPN